MALKKTLRGLGSGGAVALLVDGLIGSGQFAIIFADFFLSNMETFLALFATLSGRLAPNIEWLPEGALNKVVLALAALYVAVTIGRLIAAWNEER